MSDRKDIMLDDNNDLLISNGDFVISDSMMQDVALILLMNQGELKSDPILGCNLTKYLNASGKMEEVKRAIRMNLDRAGIDYEDVKEQMNTILKKLK